MKNEKEQAKKHVTGYEKLCLLNLMHWSNFVSPIMSILIDLTVSPKFLIRSLR